MTLITTTALTKRYPAGVTALDELTVEVEPGIVALVGANGAGKSTLIKILLGLLPATSGAASVLGLDPATDGPQVRARVGYMPEHDCLPPEQTAAELVTHLGRLSGLPRVAARERGSEALRHVGMYEERYRQIGGYSTGMKQRVKLAQALVHDPDLLFLDEPTNGMDPKGREEMLELIRDIAHNKGLSLILSSHLLPDVEYTCDYVVVMDKGAVATEGPIAGLKEHSGRVFELRVKGDAAAFVQVLHTAGLECHETEEDIMRVFVPGDAQPDGQDARRLFQLAATHGMQVRHLRASVPTLEDVFARAVGEK